MDDGKVYVLTDIDGLVASSANASRKGFDRLNGLPRSSSVPPEESERIWYTKENHGTSSVYTIGKFDGLALVVDTYGGRVR